MAIPIESLSFKPTATSTKRGLADWASDNFLNVKNFGAQGSGTDDTVAIQACFDVAFGTSGAPHGTSSTLNRPVYFPPGDYRAGNLTLTQVKGGLIYGAGAYSTVIQYTGSVTGTSAIIKTDGCENTKFQGMAFRGNGPTSTIVGVDLDWGNSGSVGLKNNTFTEIALDSLHTGLRIGESGFEGYGNYFHHVIGGNGTYGIKINSTGSNTLVICALVEMNAGSGGSISSPTGPYGYGIWVESGSLIDIDPGMAGLQTDIKWDSSGTLTVIGGRSESLNFLETTAGKVLLLSCQYDLGPSLSSSWKRFVNMTSPAVVIMDNCLGAFDPTIIGTGTLYLRGGTEFWSGADNTTQVNDYMSGFTGECREMMVDAFTFTNLPTAAEGCEAVITDANTATWGANVTASGTSAHALVRWNGSNWTVVGK